MINIVAIDIETTGLDPNRDTILEFGAMHLKSGEQFRRLIVPEDGRFSGHGIALAMNAALLSEICEIINGKNKTTLWNSSVEGLYFDFCMWLKQFDLEPKDITVLGKNFGGFDLQFLKKGGNWPYRSLDIGSLFFKYAGKVCNLSDCAAIAGIEVKNLHTSLGDCWLYGALFDWWAAKELG